MDPRCISFSTFLNENQAITVLGMPDYVIWILIAIMLIISGLFSASENAYTNCNKYHFQTLADKGNFTAKIIVKLINKFDSTLVNVLIGNNIVQTLMSYFSATLFLNMSIAYGWADGVEAILSTVVMAFLVYVISDTCPKILSKAIPNKMAIILAYPVLITSYILLPISWIFKGILFIVHKLFKIKDTLLLSKDDLIHSASLAINDEKEDEGETDDEDEEKLFENDEKDLLNNVFNFDELKVKDVYTKKEKVFSINIQGLTVSKLNEILVDVKYSRIPIYEGNKENVIGILVLKTYFEEYVKDKHLDIRSILEDIVKIDINMNIDDAFNELNKEKVHLGIVYNNLEMVGIISMEDILEELIDDIDETPLGQQTPTKVLTLASSKEDKKHE